MISKSIVNAQTLFDKEKFNVKLNNCFSKFYGVSSSVPQRSK